MDKLKILLIEPPFHRLYNKNFSLDKYPLSLGYLTSAIKKETNHDILVYNSDFVSPCSEPSLEYMVTEGYTNYISNLKNLDFFLWEEIREQIKKYNPDVVGITSKSQNFSSARIVASIVKQINKNIVVILGGPHVCMVGKDIFECADFDIAVKGEGEYTFVELINGIATKTDFANIDGLLYRSNDGTISETSDRGFIENLDNLDSPYKYAPEVLVDFKKYPLYSFRSIFATRGCPFNCLFCGSAKIWQHKVRSRTPQNVVEEIILLRKMGVNNFNFDDDTFGVTKKNIFELCDLLKTNCKGITWSCEVHVRLITDDVLKAMKSGGCDLVKIGVESGNNEMLKKIRKGITIEDAIKASKLIRKNNMHVMAFYMVGFPEETEETLADTIKAIKNTAGYVTYSIFTPYKGTDAYETSKTLGLIPEDFEASKYNHYSPANNFCKNISHERFREIVSEVEKTVDRKNVNYERKVAISRYYPINILRKILKTIK